MKRLLIVDDHPVFRNGLRQALEDTQEFEHIVEAGTGAQALTALGEGRFDLVIMDIGLPDLSGLDIIEARAGLAGAPAFFVLTMEATTELARRAFMAGAAGFASKNIALATLMLAVALVTAGELYVEGEILRDILTADVRLSQVRKELSIKAGMLTDRERATLEAMLDGLSAKEVALRLGVSLRTAENYQSAVYAKLGARTPVDLVRVALKAGLSLPD